MLQSCGCKDISLPGQSLYSDVNYCSDDRDIADKCHTSPPAAECYNALGDIHGRLMCVRNVTARVARSTSAIRDCRCHSPCSEISYDVTYSLSRWPAESFDGEQAFQDIIETEDYPSRFEEPEDIEKLSLYESHFHELNRREAMRDFARLNVYIADSNVLKTEEQVDYTLTQLLADIGGQLGLWVGVSVITLAEVLELLVEILKYFSTVHGPYSQGRQFSRRRSDTYQVSTECQVSRDFHASSREFCPTCGRCTCSNGNSTSLPAEPEVDKQF